MTTPTAPRVLLVGDLDAPELAPAVSWLSAQFSREATPPPPTRPSVPEAIVICQSRPGHVGRKRVDEFHRDYPHSRLIALLGPWCEGEVRAAKPLLGVTRIYWHQWRSRLPRELQHESSDASSLPRTGTEVDLLVSRPAPRRAERPALIGVVARRQLDYEAIAWVLAAGGHHGVWILADRAPPVLAVDLVVIDGDLRSVPRPLRSSPAILLADFPRPGETAAAGGLAKLEVLAKPYSMADLLDRVSALVATPSGAAAPRTFAA